MFHDQKENRLHYDGVSGEKRELYYQRFDAAILDQNPIVAGLLSSAFENLFPSRVGDLLDLGCGTGFYYPLLKRHADRITGVDVSREMLRDARQTILANGLEHCHVIESSAFDLPLKDQSFDVVHCWDFFHHVSNVGGTLSEITRVLKPNGRLILVEPNLINPSITWYHARRRSEWRLFLQNQFTLPRKLREDFEWEIRYDNTIISFLNSKTHWIWKAADRFTSVRPFHLMSFRYVIDATLR